MLRDGMVKKWRRSGCEGRSLVRHLSKGSVERPLGNREKGQQRAGRCVCVGL